MALLRGAGKPGDSLGIILRYTVSGRVMSAHSELGGSISAVCETAKGIKVIRLGLAGNRDGCGWSHLLRRRGRWGLLRVKTGDQQQQPDDGDHHSSDNERKPALVRR